MIKNLSVLTLVLFSFSALADEAQPSLDQAAPSSSSLSKDDQEILDRGEIGSDRYLGGIITGLIPGFGLGQEIQGRWSQKGWIFTSGESLSLITMGLVAVNACGGLASNQNSCTLPLTNNVGFYLFAGFKIWEIFDAIVTPLHENARYRELKNLSKKSVILRPYLSPNPSGGFIGGLALAF